MPLPTMKLSGAEKSLLPWDTNRPPGLTVPSMGAEPQLAHRRRSAPKSKRKDRRRFASPESKQEWDQASIAKLSSTQISDMSRAELARIVRAARLPTVQIRPEYADRVTLERLAHLACLCCHNRQDLSTPVRYAGAVCGF